MRVNSRGLASRVAAAVAMTMIVCATNTAHANVPQDVFGVSARLNGMGGAGTAAAFDYAAAYYNPASLSFCPVSMLSASFSRANLNLSVDSETEAVTTDSAGVRTAIDLGICTHGPYNLTFGFMFGTGLEAPQRFGQNSIDALPRFILYGPKMDQLSIILGMAYQIVDSLSVGVGAAVLINSDLQLTNEIPVLVEGQEVTNEITWELQPRVAPYFGVSYRPVENVHLGVTYRGALYHRLDAVAFTQVNAVGIDLEIDLLLESVAWYSPQQAAFGASFSPTPGVTIAGDLTWYNWSNDPGPFIRASPYQGSPVAETLDFPEPFEGNYRDIVQPRFGVEYTWREMVDFRGGYSLRPWIVPLPDGQTNLLDSTTHTISLGGGYRWGARISDEDGEAPAVETELGPDTPLLHPNRIDTYLRVYLMTDRDVSKLDPQPFLNEYSYGGTVFDVGFTLTLGWF